MNDGESFSEKWLMKIIKDHDAFWVWCAPSVCIIVPSAPLSLRVNVTSVHSSFLSEWNGARDGDSLKRKYQREYNASLKQLLKITAGVIQIFTFYVLGLWVMKADTIQESHRNILGLVFFDLQRFEGHVGSKNHKWTLMTKWKQWKSCSVSQVQKASIHYKICTFFLCPLDPGKSVRLQKISPSSAVLFSYVDATFCEKKIKI